MVCTSGAPALLRARSEHPRTQALAVELLACGWELQSTTDAVLREAVRVEEAVIRREWLHRRDGGGSWTDSECCRAWDHFGEPPTTGESNLPLARSASEKYGIWRHFTSADAYRCMSITPKTRSWRAVGEAGRCIMFVFD